MPTKSVFVIVVDDVTSLQRDRIHELVKTNTDDWWHELKDLWIVTGRTAAAWRDLVDPVLKGQRSPAVVLKVAAREGGRWATSGALPGLSEWFERLE